MRSRCWLRKLNQRTAFISELRSCAETSDQIKKRCQIPGGIWHGKTDAAVAVLFRRNPEGL